MSISPIPGRTTAPISTSGSYPLVGYVPWEARTNLALQSEDIMTTWTTSGGARNANQYVAPNGTLTMDQMVGDGVSTNQAILQAITTSAGASVFSFYARYDTTRWINARLYDGTNSFIASFDILNGAVGSLAAGTTSSIERINSTMYRCQVKTATGLSSAGGQLLVAQQIADTASIAAHTNAITDKTGVWGFQYEAGSFATPYIPTTTVAVARNSSVLTYTGADVANIKTLAATFAYPAVVNAATNYTVVSVDDGSLTTNSSTMRVAGDTLKLGTLTFSGSALQSLQAHTNVINSASHKCAITWPANGIISVIDGGDAKTDASNTPPAGLTTLRIGAVSTGQNLNGSAGGIYGWTRNLSQSELNAITA